MSKKRYIVTGGAGFFGSILCDHLVRSGCEVISIDRLVGGNLNGSYKNIQLDIRNSARLIESLQNLGRVDAIFHLAALLAHDKSNLSGLWDSNVDGTRNVMRVARQLKIPKVVFTSTNCVFSTGFAEPVDETTPTNPIEIYGKSKLEAERIILNEFSDVQTAIIRCPTIMEAGRLGLMTILFDFVREGRRLYIVGDGSNRYSFIAAGDLALACAKAAELPCAGIYHIGSDNVPTMYELFRDLMLAAGKKPRLACLPEQATVFTLKTLNKLNLSPLGPYHYRMLAANFVFDNRKIKNDLNWSPSRTNSEILNEAYRYYVDHLQEITSGSVLGSGKSAHQSQAKAGILNLLRLIS